MSPKGLPPYLQRWFDKKTRRQYIFFRKRGCKTVPLPLPIGSDAFWTAYNAALKGKAEIGADLRSSAGSVSAAIAAYLLSHQWGELADGTRAMRRAILERLRERYGQWPLRQINENFIEAYLNTLKPHAARNHLKALRALLQHAKHDVTRGIKAPKAKSAKHPSWPAEVMAQYEAAHPVGSKARLCFALARYTGAARAEIARLGPQHVAGNVITIARQKTGVKAVIELLPELRAVIEATPLTGLQTFMITKSGKPYAPNDLSDQFRQWCVEAALPKEYTLHGLRHAMGDAIAEAGGSPSEIGAVLGHASAKSSLHYAQEANRKLMARNAMARLRGSTNPVHSGNPDVSNHNPDLTLENAKSLKEQKNG
jgi:integrase